MKKLLLSFVFMMMGALFFVLPASANSSVNFSISPGETIVVYLSRNYKVTDVSDNAGDFVSFDWYISGNNTPSLKYSAVSVDAGSTCPVLNVTAQTDDNNKGSVYGYFTAHPPYTSYDISVTVAVSVYNSSSSSFNSSVSLAVLNWSFADANLTNLETLDNKLNQILTALGESNTIKFAGDTPVWYLHDSYFGWASSGFDSNGYPNVGSSGSLLLQFTHDDDYINSYLAPGDYYFVISSPHGVLSITFDDSNSSGNYDLTNRYTVEKVNSGKFQSNSSPNFFSIYHIHVTEPLVGYIVRITFSGTTSGVCSGALIPFTLDQSASAVITDEFNDKVDEVNNAGQQQAQQEEDTWNNINSYKGDLDFSIDWSEAASGLSYVSGIFMMIWNNSPTEIITLSLMLGIAMLGIGRGVQAAIRVSRNSGRKGGDGDA